MPETGYLPSCGDVAKWPKAVVCKTIIRRFKSARRLQLLFLGLVPACYDPPVPAPSPRMNTSNAVYVEWRREDEPVRRPVVLVVDQPGGPADRVVADLDVTTFLNDRFHPVFREGDPGPPGTVQFFAVTGCPLTEPFTPQDARHAIEVANRVVVHPLAQPGWSPRLQLGCPPAR